MKILVTGAAGFIGFHICKLLLKNRYKIIGLDSINDYYDQNLKFSRLSELGVTKEDAKKINTLQNSFQFDNFQFIRLELEKKIDLNKLFERQQFDIVLHLAAQAGVRYGLDNPTSYISSNMVGFFNILECSKNCYVEHFIYASSSSIYGLNSKLPFEVSDKSESPASLYAATKKSNELMAHSYSHIFNLKTTGLRFFTVYGPWGRPDMALFLFTKAILNNEKINVFNYGEMERDFTYIDDLTKILLKIVEKRNPRKNTYKVYNIGGTKPIKLMSMIELLEKEIGKKAIIRLAGLQPGDITKTYAEQEDLIKDFNVSTEITSMKDGIKKFLNWYMNYNGHNI